MIGYAGPAAGAGREARARRADGHRHLAASPRSSAPARRKHFDILGHQDVRLSCEIRVHPTGKAIARFGTKSQGQGHETTYAQIIAEELGIPADDIQVEEGDTDTAPYGLGTYASRSHADRRRGRARWPRARSATRRGRSPRTCWRSREDDLEWEPGKFYVKGSPEQVEDDPGDRLRGLHQPPAGDGGRARGGRLLRPAEPDLPVRQLHLRRRHRPGHRRGQGPPLRGGRRLRQHHQPDDRRGADPRRPDDGPGPGAVRGDHLRRERQHPRRELHGLPAARPRWRRRTGRPTRPSPRRRTIRSAPRAWASRRRSARRRPSPTRSWTRSGTSACATSTSRSRRRRCGGILQEKGVAE